MADHYDDNLDHTRPMSDLGSPEDEPWEAPFADAPYDADEDTDARWEPIPDDAWAIEDARWNAAGDEAAPGAAADDPWLRPAQTVVRQRPAAAPTSVSAPAPAADGFAAAPRQQPAGTARVLRRSRTSQQEGWATAPDWSATDDATTAGEGGSSRPPRVRRSHKPARHGCLSSLLWLVMLGVAAVMALRFLPADLANGRAVPEVVALVPWLFAPIVVCLALAALWRRRLLAVVCVAAAAVMLWWHAGFLLPGTRVSDAAIATAQSGADASDNVARIMTLNTCNGGASAEEVVELVRSRNVEILCLQELTDDFVAELETAGISELLPYHVISDEASAISNGGRNGIWTLAPMSDVSGNLLPIETSSMPAGTISIGGRDVRVVSVHPNSPVRGAQDLWDEGLSVIGSLAGYDHAYLVMGDFNSTWDHARFRELLGTAFVDAGETAGEGFHMTYPSGGLIPSLVEIDHIVYARDSGMTVSGLAAVEVTGSDHRALLGVLEVTG